MYLTEIVIVLEYQSSLNTEGKPAPPTETKNKKKSLEIIHNIRQGSKLQHTKSNPLKSAQVQRKFHTAASFWGLLLLVLIVVVIDGPGDHGAEDVVQLGALCVELFLRRMKNVYGRHREVGNSSNGRHSRALNR